MNNFHRFLVIICWFFPLFAFLVLFFKDVPANVKKHANWSLYWIFIIVLVTFVIGVTAGFTQEASGTPWIPDAQALSIISTIYSIGFFINLLAVLAGKGPFFTQPAPERSMQ